MDITPKEYSGYRIVSENADEIVIEIPEDLVGADTLAAMAASNDGTALYFARMLEIWRSAQKEDGECPWEWRDGAIRRRSVSVFVNGYKHTLGDGKVNMVTYSHRKP